MVKHNYTAEVILRSGLVRERVFVSIRNAEGFARQVANEGGVCVVKNSRDEIVFSTVQKSTQSA